jgi:glycosyltransferase involved in cell wall biosynthesis
VVGRDLVAGRNAAEVVDNLLAVLDDESLRSRLIEHGTEQYATHHSSRAVAQQVTAAIDEAARRGPLAVAPLADLRARRSARPGQRGQSRDPLAPPPISGGRDRPRVLVAGGPFELSASRTDGFVDRHRQVVQALSTDHDVHIVALRAAGDESLVAEQFSQLPYHEVIMPPEGAWLRSGSRANRLAFAAARFVTAPLSPWEAELVRVGQAIAPDAVLGIDPWIDVEYRALFRRYWSVYLFEEDLTRPGAVGPRSRQAQLLWAVEMAAKRRAGLQPDVVVHISDAERAAAGRLFPRAATALIPHTLDPSEWPLADGAAEGSDVIVVAQLMHRRNADGLIAILHEIEKREAGDRLPIRLVSGAGVHDDLKPFLDRRWVTLSPPVERPWGEYRTAFASLVPAMEVTGFKTTVLQAWTAGCPTVCFPASAATLGPKGPSAVLVGDDASQIVDHLLALQSSAELRKRLVDAGLRVATEEHGHDAAMNRLKRLLSPRTTSKGH